jgi:hypothetical protein
MTQRAWFPVGADQQLKLGGLLPRCDDPPTIALALEAATRAASKEEEEPRGRDRN